MSTPLIRRLLAPVVQLREGESTTAAFMFAYSFLAMTAYNILKPITRSKFISDLGADNLPWVQLVAGILIGFIMQGYSRAIGFVPRRWAIPVTQAGCVVLILAFWVLFQSGQDWPSVAFYVLGLILGILLISQFWTLANDIYDPRQAKRLFGFIGGGASLGGATGAAITAFVVKEVGTVNLLLVSAAIMIVCLLLVIAIVRRESSAGASTVGAEEEGVSGGEAIRMLRESKHLQIIAIVIACAAMGAAIIEQQLNMAAESRLGAGQTDNITAFLAQVTVYLSLIGFVIQVGLTSRIHRLLGLGFALMILPVSLGATGLVMLFNGALWAPALARVLDTSLRYTVDKTTREILFLPLPASIKYRAKPFVDVTMDRFAKAMGALLILVLIKPWGLSLDWQRLSIASLTLMAIWIVMALRARGEYLATFRRSIEHREVAPADIRSTQADLQTIETLVEELAHPDERRVIYAMDLLESLEKRNLITPLLLYHTSPVVRARTLRALQSIRPGLAEQWLPAIERLLADEDAAVRAGAVRAIAAIRGREAVGLMRPYLEDPNPRIAVTAAVSLAASPDETDVQTAYATLQRLSRNARDNAAPARREVARALAHIANPRFRDLLVPLMDDANLEVARSAIRSAGRLGPDSFLFVARLVSLLRNRLLKADARAVLVGYGDAVVEPLAYFLGDQDEDLWVRRHVPATLARIPSVATVDTLVKALDDRDGFLRYKAVVALDRLHRERPDLAIARQPIEAMIQSESLRYFNALTLHYNLFVAGSFPRRALLGRALEEKQGRSRARIFHLLGLVYPPADIDAARFAIEHGDARARASAAEYLDNILEGAIRKRVMLIIEDMPADERVKRANTLFRTRRRDAEDTLAQLIHDDAQIVAAAAIHMTAERGIWKLADDIEHALAHRDVHDWYVFEAASWALAARQMAAEERRARWLEPLPSVELADRLRSIPLFDYVSVDELFRVAGTGRQVRHEPGRAFYQAGSPPDSLHFLIDGEVDEDNGEGQPSRRRAPTVLAFEEILEGTPARSTVRAVEVAISLSLTREEFLTLLSDNIELANGLFKLLLDTRFGSTWRRVVRGCISNEIAALAADGLRPIERVLLLQTSPLLARATGEQLLRLADISREVPLVEGAVLCGENDVAAIYGVLSGELVIDARGEPPTIARAGDSIGIYETLAAIPAGATVRVSKAGTALRIDGRELFDLLADDIDLVQGLFSALLHAEPLGEPVGAS
jgi:ATP/ADP translocase/HEAT repeat protein/CRP-like cAMP-binding protein